MQKDLNDTMAVLDRYARTVYALMRHSRRTGRHTFHHTRVQVRVVKHQRAALVCRVVRAAT